MASGSAIEWTGDTANVFYVIAKLTGRRGWICIMVSPGCANCYAEKLNLGFFQFGTGHRYVLASLDEVEPVFDRRLAEGWARKRLPRIIFINSMTDTFGEFYPDEWVYELLDYMAAAPQHTFQVLTKRAERTHQMVTAWLNDRGKDRVPKHVHLMVSVENQKWADRRIPWLVKLPCVHGLSVEPLLGPIPNLSLEGVDWVIVGGESQGGARPMHAQWARDIRDQCARAGVPFFFKQWGMWLHGEAADAGCFRWQDDTVRKPWRKGIHRWPDGSLSIRLGKKAAGRLLDGRIWDEIPRGVS